MLATTVNVVKRENVAPNIFRLRMMWEEKQGSLPLFLVASDRSIVGSLAFFFFLRPAFIPVVKTPIPPIPLLTKDPWGNVSPGTPSQSLGFHCPISPSHLSSPMSLSLRLLLASDQLICAKMLIILSLNQSSSVFNIPSHRVYEIYNNPH